MEGEKNNMNIQDLVRERVIGNIKTGKKNEKGIPEKLPYFHVEEDKDTSYDMVEIFKQLYPGQPTKLKIRFTSENPFNFKFKRYVNGKAVCIGNGTKAITVGKDSKNNNTQIEVECNEECSHRQSGKCKLKGTLKFALDGIEAGGVWNLSTSGGISLSNIASEIVKYKRAGMSIVGVPFAAPKVVIRKVKPVPKAAQLNACSIRINAFSSIQAEFCLYASIGDNSRMCADGVCRRRGLPFSRRRGMIKL